MTTDRQNQAARKKRTGTNGEQIAANYLRGKGYTIVVANWSCRRGEIDIIARDGAMLVFVEVRTRRTHTTEESFASITPTKRARLIASAHTYIAQNCPDAPLWRIDVVGIALPPSGPPCIDHVEDALDW